MSFFVKSYSFHKRNEDKWVRYICGIFYGGGIEANISKIVQMLVQWSFVDFINWRASEASEPLSGQFNRARRWSIREDHLLTVHTLL